MSQINRLRWKCRRGTLELDLLLLHFLDRDYPQLETTAQAAFEALLEAGDEDLWAIIQGEMPSPNADCEQLMQRLRAC